MRGPTKLNASRKYYMDEWLNGPDQGDPNKGCVMAMLISCCIWFVIVVGVLLAR